MEILSQIIPQNDPFPNNQKLPFLIYKNCLKDLSAAQTEKLFLKNGWVNIWVNGIYPFHHYHSNIHEVLAIVSGSCKVQIGGENGSIFVVKKNDVLILPVGTSHKNVGSTDNFSCVGAYPFDIPYDMCYQEKEPDDIAIPKKDPIFGEKGPLFDYWRSIS